MQKKFLKGNNIKMKIVTYKMVYLLLFTVLSIQGRNFMNNFKIKKIIDLSHTLTAENPTWDGSCGFNLSTTLDHHECSSETKYKLHALYLKKAGVGTHIDAPLHCFPDQAPVAELPLENFFVKAYIIDVSSISSAEYKISADDIVSFEKLHGSIQENSLVIAYTGWSKYWSDSKKYRNENKDGIMQFPSYSAEAVQLLVNRNVAGIAIDTLSPDCPGSGDPVHRLILSNNKYIIENIANAHLLPSVGAYVIALPLKINATEAPIRIVGLIPEDYVA